MADLNRLEVSILERLSAKYPAVKEHIPLLKVLSRENTGVGMYVNFYYPDAEGFVKDLDMPDAAISTNENIEIEGLRYGLGYEVDISGGRIKFIELITYGEEWDGVATDFTFTTQ